MNDRQAAALQAVIEAMHPDAAVTVTPHPGGADVTVSGALCNPGLSGPGGGCGVVLSVGPDSPFVKHLLARAAARAR